jgi:hypothetical protein
VLVERAEELHPEWVSGDHGRHAGRDAQADRHRPDLARHGLGAASRDHDDEQDPGQGRAEQDLLGDQQLGGHQQAQPQAAAHGARPPER